MQKLLLFSALAAARQTINEFSTTLIDDTLPGGPREKTVVYQAPWIRCDREQDYAVAWKHFAERLGTVENG